MPLYHLFQLHLTNRQIHAINEGRGGGLDDAMLAARLGNREGVDAALGHALYRPVAILEATDLEDLYTRTNSIDAPWYRAPEITLLVPGGAPSTSCGDIALDADARQAWVCASIGWEPLDDAARAALERMAGFVPPEPDTGPERP
ncbi:hypothetical protein LAZ40_03195 [Cereibacter sphaeroides]|uniref:hypothetical protein n=1 Tax=Cereibacter sphaeroides TaxID=1063 RepID=UPI001F3F2D58|nr:hypothetical protein [Cereibacter sphaeroides]MCE6958061.1 hypothetical protein [Cereibacter sphaeroides]MCE6971346.1 hypothetical protein [Cereibacter sphaeroides]